MLFIYNEIRSFVWNKSNILKLLIKIKTGVFYPKHDAQLYKIMSRLKPNSEREKKKNPSIAAGWV